MEQNAKQFIGWIFLEEVALVKNVSDITKPVYTITISVQPQEMLEMLVFSTLAVSKWY